MRVSAIEPVGITKASTTKPRIIRAKVIAKVNDSKRLRTDMVLMPEETADDEGALEDWVLLVRLFIDGLGAIVKKVRFFIYPAGVLSSAGCACAVKSLGGTRAVIADNN